MKKLTALLLSLLILFSLTACAGSPTVAGTEGFDDPSSSEPPKPVYYANPLTGVPEYTDKKLTEKRPVALMINNISTAQGVQTGLNAADIVYETEVEGGITRLMAVFKDVSKAGQLGTVRSARYPYIDLAYGHDAIYAHCGIDPTYAAPHLKKINLAELDINTAAANYGFRQSNGLAYEHTMYTSGEKLAAGVEHFGFRNTVNDSSPWLDFDPDCKVEGDSSCINVKVPFSNKQATTFAYDEQSKKYIRGTNGKALTDYKTKEKEGFKNVFVLLTTIVPYNDGYHMKVSLESGSGWYVSNGTVKEIKWSKAGESAPITFTNADGTAFTCNAGNSYVCIMSKKFTPTFTPKPEETSSAVSQ